MDEHSFDAVADNLLATLAELKVPQDIVDDVVAIVLPFRDLFEVSTHAATRATARRLTPFPPLCRTPPPNSAPRPRRERERGPRRRRGGAMMFLFPG